jgi:CDP-glycerol glycerophosphotransferase (TagB/SpsB family)
MSETTQKFAPIERDTAEFDFTPSGIKVSIPPSLVAESVQLVMEHPKTKNIWILTQTATNVWLLPFDELTKKGSYQFRYINTITNTSRILGSDLGQLAKRDDERFLKARRFQRSGKLFNAEFYIPYTKKSARLRVSDAFTPSRQQRKIEHCSIKSIALINNEFKIIGTAFVPGVPSLDLQPVLLIKNEANEEILRVPGERKRSMGNQTRYGFDNCDYTYSGYSFRLQTKQIFIDERLKAPSRLKLYVALVSSTGETYERILKATPASLKSRARTICSIKKPFKPNVLSIISASASDEILITHRIEDKTLSRINKLKRALTYRAFQILNKPKSDAWLMYEFEAAAAQDNAVALFEELQDKRKDLNVKFLIDSRCPDADRLKKYGKNIVKKYSFRHYWYLLTSRTLISSQSRYHGYRLAPPMSDPIARQMAKTPFVFLQHGVIALKKISFHRSNPRVACNLFFSSTEFEQSIICREYGYSKEEVPLIGLPRFDQLLDKSATAKEILVMPTWRKWLQHCNSHNFKYTEFFRNYYTFLNSERLTKICQDQGLTINFYLHPMIAKNIDCFRNLPAHVRIISAGKEPINELMMRAGLLVTDYSSIAWDFIYMKKPVAFFHFDLPDYDKAHGSYFDLKETLGRSSADKPNELVALIKAWAQGGRWPAPALNNFTYTDRNNRSRAISAIEHMLSKIQ